MDFLRFAGQWLRRRRLAVPQRDDIAHRARAVAVLVGDVPGAAVLNTLLVAKIVELHVERHPAAVGATEINRAAYRHVVAADGRPAPNQADVAGQRPAGV